MKLLTLFCMLVGSIYANGAYADKYDKFSTMVTSIYINSSGLMIIEVDGVDGYLSLGTVEEKYAQVMYSTALAAKLSNTNTVRVRYYDAVDGQDFPTVSIVQIN